MRLAQAQAYAARLLAAGVTQNLVIGGAASDGRGKILPGALWLTPQEIKNDGLAEQDMVFYGSIDGGASFDQDIEAQVKLLERATPAAFVSLAAMYGTPRDVATGRLLNLPGVLPAVTAALKNL